MAVTRRVFVASGAVTAASYLLGVNRAAAARRRKRVFAHAGLAQGVGTVGLTVARTRYLETGSQAAVALTPADGEIISGTTQSNFQSNGFWERNGFTRAADWTGPNPLGGNFAGFDDVNFLPISSFLTDFDGTGFYTRMDDLGLNGMLPCAGSVNLANNITFAKWAVVTSEVNAGGTISAGNDPGVIGVHTGEEPFDLATYHGYIADATTWLASSDGPGRIHFFNFLDNLLNGEIVFTYFPDDMVLGRDATHPDPPPQWTFCDAYWFAGSGANSAAILDKLHGRLYVPAFTNVGAATATQCARGSHYGSMMDSIRKAYPVGDVRPFGVWIENGAPFSEAQSTRISPAQMGWAIWSTFVHGARSINYFNHTFRDGDPGLSFNNFDTDFYGGPGIAGTGMYAAAKQINRRALALAPVLNSPFDGYFVYGDTEFAGAIANAGFLTAVTSTNARTKYGGVDASCRWLPTAQKHYILATTREVDGSTNWPVTFRMVDQGQTTAVEVHEANSIAIQRGGAIPGGFCEFSDTFATAATYKTYRID